MNEDEWFNLVKEKVNELHELSHNLVQHGETPDGSFTQRQQRVREVAAIMQGIVDLADWLSNSSSWDGKYLLPYDRRSLQQSWDQWVGWRLK